MLDIIGKRLAKEDIGFLKLTGASSKESRAKMVAQFQAGEVPVFLISLKAGGVGPGDRPRAPYWPATYRDRVQAHR